MNSHEFIRFPPYELVPTASVMMLLGAIQAKIEQIRHIPILPSDRDEFRILYFSRAVHGTTSIEGNSLSAEAVETMVREPRERAYSNEYDEQEVQNVIDALNSIASDVLHGVNKEFSVEYLNRYHRILISDTGSPNCDESEIGTIRHREVTVGRYGGAPAKTCPLLMTKFCDWLNEAKYEPRGHVEGYEIAWQIVKAIIAHLYFEWIHPYCDGNGRMGRLIEFQILYRAGVPDIAAHLFSNMYNKQRSQYLEELQDSHGDYNDGSYPSEANIQRFVEFALEGYRSELDEQSSSIYSAQTTVMWHDFIHSSFPKNPSNVEQRRKRLALDLTHPRFQNRPVSFDEIRELTPALAIAYLNKTDRTIRNDLYALVEMKLLQQDANGYKPNMDILQGFFGPSTTSAD